MNVEIILWTNVLLAVVLLGTVVYYLFSVYRLNKRETYAVIVNNDGRTTKTTRLNLKKSTFRSGGGAYNIVTDRLIKFGNKRLLLYRENRADPISMTAYGDSRLDADTYQHILDNAVIRALNSSNPLLGLDTKKWLLIGAGVLLFFVANAQGWI